MHDSDKSGTLNPLELAQLAAQFGLAPKSKVGKEKMMAMVPEMKVELDFGRFLQVLHALRQQHAESRQAELREMFTKYDKDNSGHLSTTEICKLLEECGLA